MRALAAALTGWTLLVSAAPPFVLADVPHSIDTERLNQRISNGRLVQIHTRAGRFETEDATAEAKGIAYRGVVASAISDSLPVPGLIAWDQIRKVDVRGSSWGAGAFYGSVICAATLGTLAGLYLPQEGRTPAVIAGTAAYGALVGGGIGLVLGAGIGLLFPAWHPVYRPTRE